MSCDPNACNCCLVPQRASAEEPCQTCYVVKCAKKPVCRTPFKPKSGEPPCGCIYGCPCKAACYDWNPCVKPLDH